MLLWGSKCYILCLCLALGVCCRWLWGVFALVKARVTVRGNVQGVGSTLVDVGNLRR